MFSAIAFDMDDTLYPEHQFVTGGYRAAAAWAYNKWQVDINADLERRFNQGERGDLFTPTLQALGITPTLMETLALVQTYREHKPTITPYHDVKPALTQLHAAGLQLALVSDGIWQVQRRKWQALKLSNYITTTIFSDEFGRPYWKPHTRPFAELAQRLAISPKQIVYIGDNPHKDFIGARATGMTTLRLRRPDGLHTNTQLDRHHEADHQFNTLTDIARWIIASRSDQFTMRY